MARTEYFNLAIPAPHRLAMMRADLATHATRYPRCPATHKPADWRAIRAYTLKGWTAAFGCLSNGMEGGSPVWYSHQGPEFRDERDAESLCSIRHSGWFTDVHQTDLAIGIVGRLTHGRFIAGYRWTSNDERVYYPEVFDDETEAARMADEHARVFAELAREDSERFDRMQTAETEMQDAADALRDTWALRRAGRRDSSDVSDAVETLRNARAELADATADYERGE